MDSHFEILFGTSSLDDFPTGHFQFVHPKQYLDVGNYFPTENQGLEDDFPIAAEITNFQCFFSRKHWHVLRWGPRQQGAVSGRWVGKKDGSFFCNINGCAQIN